MCKNFKVCHNKQDRLLGELREISISANSARSAQPIRSFLTTPPIKTVFKSRSGIWPYVNEIFIWDYKAHFSVVKTIFVKEFRMNFNVIFIVKVFDNSVTSLFLL